MMRSQIQCQDCDVLVIISCTQALMIKRMKLVFVVSMRRPETIKSKIIECFCCCTRCQQTTDDSTTYRQEATVRQRRVYVIGGRFAAAGGSAPSTVGAKPAMDRPSGNPSSPPHASAYSGFGAFCSAISETLSVRSGTARLNRSDALQHLLRCFHDIIAARIEFWRGFTL